MEVWLPGEECWLPPTLPAADGDAAVGDITDLNVGADKTLSTALEQDDKLLDLVKEDRFLYHLLSKKSYKGLFVFLKSSKIFGFETYK